MVKHPNLVGPNNHKTLKIPVFGGLWVYLVIFEFVAMTPQENLVLFDLLICHFQCIWDNLNLVFLIEKITDETCPLNPAILCNLSMI